MTNAERFRSPDERRYAFSKFCSRGTCAECRIWRKFKKNTNCHFIWLELEYEEWPKPCPFCGNKDIRVYKGEDGSKYAACCGCGCRTDFQKTDEMAIAAWNRRV